MTTMRQARKAHHRQCYARITERVRVDGDERDVVRTRCVDATPFRKWARGQAFGRAVGKLARIVRAS